MKILGIKLYQHAALIPAGWCPARGGELSLGAEGLPATVLQKQHWELLKDMLKEGMFSPLAAAGPSAPLPSLGSVGFGRSARAAGGRGWRSPGSGRRTGSWPWAAGLRCLCRAALQEVRGVIRRKWDGWHWGGQGAVSGTSNSACSGRHGCRCSVRCLHGERWG